MCATMLPIRNEHGFSAVLGGIFPALSANYSQRSLEYHESAIVLHVDTVSTRLTRKSFTGSSAARYKGKWV